MSINQFEAILGKKKNIWQNDINIINWVYIVSINFIPDKKLFSYVFIKYCILNSFKFI